MKMATDFMTLDEKMDEIFETVDNLMQEGKFEELNKKFETLSEHDDKDIVLSWLTVSLAAKSKLPARKDYFDRVKLIFGSKGESLLKGLE